MGCVGDEWGGGGGVWVCVWGVYLGGLVRGDWLGGLVGWLLSWWR